MTNSEIHELMRYAAQKSREGNREEAFAVWFQVEKAIENVADPIDYLGLMVCSDVLFRLDMLVEIP